MSKLNMRKWKITREMKMEWEKGFGSSHFTQKSISTHIHTIGVAKFHIIYEFHSTLNRSTLLHSTKQRWSNLPSKSSNSPFSSYSNKHSLYLDIKQTCTKISIIIRINDHGNYIVPNKVLKYSPHNRNFVAHDFKI